MTLRRGRLVLPGLGAGVLLALSLPPWGWWPLAPIGYAVLYRRLDGVAIRGRLLATFAAGIGVFGIGLFWMSEFSIPGAVLAVLLHAAFLAAGGALTPPVRYRVPAFVGAMTLTEAFRMRWPFGGVPLGGVPLGQIGGPAGPAARLGGGLVLLAIAVLVGAGGVELVRRRWVGAVALPIAVVLVIAGALAPNGHATGKQLRIAIVQGGGPRGYTHLQTEEAAAYDRQVAASVPVRGPLDLVLWPEDVVHVPTDVADTPEGADLSALAQRTNATVVAGVVEEIPGGFHNLAVAWSPGGDIVSRYEKVRRVPFGEYVPLRGLVKHVADLSAVPDDAIPGHGPAILRTPAGPLGTLISYEVFFANRARSAIKAGAQVLLVPTNAASFSTSQVPTQEVAGARLRAVETGRWLAQAAPTGYSAVVDPDGTVHTRSHLGKRRVITATVGLRTGRTPYVRWGDLPAVALSTLAVAGCWAAVRRRDGQIAPA
ncbi:MAG TPA: apolipoprotein N-acyltransferase [Acidimicrobiales bacterium]|nr:apolipoprotein N-acyltransferase [Acidimicrobiales bacterium]